MLGVCDARVVGEGLRATGGREELPEHWNDRFGPVDDQERHDISALFAEVDCDPGYRAVTA